MSDMTVAETILQQLGGNKFITMTGAKNFVGRANGLSFKLPSNFALFGINYVYVELTQMDVYTVTFSRTRGMKAVVISTFDNVYGDRLRSLFTSETGLETSL